MSDRAKRISELVVEIVWHNAMMERYRAASGKIAESDILTATNYYKNMIETRRAELETLLTELERP